MKLDLGLTADLIILGFLKLSLFETDRHIVQHSSIKVNDNKLFFFLSPGGAHSY